MSAQSKAIYTTETIPDPGIRELLGRDARWQAWLDVEANLARAQAGLGMIPEAAAKEISIKARLELLDRARIEEGLRRTGHPLVPLVWELSRVCAEQGAKYVHWGATTQNIVQTGDLLQLRKVHGIFLHQLGEILEAMGALAARSHDMALPGRTHGQHAVPLTFGYKVAVWIDEVCRHVERLRGVEPRVFVAMLGGAVGSFASFGAQGIKLQARLAELLDMRPMTVPARTLADHQAEYVCLLGLLAASSAKIAQEVYTLMKQEFGEVEEPVPEGAVGSSTMPQKRNPVLCQDIMAGAARIKALVPLALEAMQVEHEADRGRSLMIREATHQACEAMGDVLARLGVVMGGLRLNPERMRRNLDLTDGLIMGEALMLSLGERIGRQEAHDVVYEAAQAAAVTGSSFRELLLADATVSEHLNEQEVERLLDPLAYTGLCSQIATEQAARARETAAELLAQD
ncbi:MAG: adenylosuccinate lyase family protein [SAR324 cluster bacterium]|nr:adenylosuccinate lyase family protein [SAR324 cluster bacterium]